MKAWLLVACVGVAGSAACVMQSAELLPEPDLPELRWIADTADPVAVLTRQPTACLEASVGPQRIRLMRQGQLVFESSALLGGQAANLGLSCHSCHRNGRGNPDFFLRTVSDRAGHADVTSGVFSTSLADNIFNPVQIPDLGTKDGTDQVNRADLDELEAFTLNQIINEFSGSEPTDVVLASLLSFLQAIAPEACSTDATESIEWRTDWNAALEAIDVSWSYSSFGDQDTAQFFIATARLRLGKLFARYDRVEHQSLRESLVALSRQIQQGEKPDTADVILLERQLELSADSSLYSPDQLRIRLGR